MKKLTLLLMACAVAVMGFAAGGNITYELNGGVTNDYGWSNKSDMFEAFMIDAGAKAGWSTLEEFKALANPFSGTTGIGNFLTTCAVLDDNATKWGWLKAYAIAVTTKWKAENPTSTAADLNVAALNSAGWRYAVAAFFVQGVMTGWPYTADFTIAGDPAAFFPAWGKGFAGPSSYDGSAAIILPEPYKENWIFDGWFENADFSGSKVISIPEGAEGDKTYYAKWIDVPTNETVWALPEGTATKAGGVVTLVVGSNVFVQDITGGLLIKFTETPTVVAGEKISVTGVTAVNGNYVNLNDAVLLEKESAQMPIIQIISLATLKADEVNEYKTYIYEWIQIVGLTIKSYDAEGYATLGDDANNTIFLALKLNQTEYPVGTKIDFKGVLDFSSQLCLNTAVANIKKSPVAGKDAYNYAAMNEHYTLTNKWLYSNQLDNFAANKIAITDVARGMVAKDGKMYFIDSELEQIVVVDGETGIKLTPIKLENKIFQNCEKPVLGGMYALNDLKIDNSGNILLSNGITSNKKPFEVWKINLTDGTGTLVVSEILLENPDYAELSIRLDAFGVYGDVNNNAIIMASNANSMEVYKWTVKNGVAGKAESIEIATDVAGTYLTGLSSPGSAPRVFPLDEYYFYLDGNAIYPTLIDASGNVVDGFYNNEAVLNDETTIKGQTIKLNQGPNGVLEFELNGEHFLITGGTNTDGVPRSTFRLFKFADANKLFSGLESLWSFPANGLGGLSNSYRAAISSVKVDGNVAKIYIYYGENGYGMYEFSSLPTRLNKVEESIVSISLEGDIIRLSNEVKSIDVYSITGRLISNSKNVSDIKAPLSKGLYLIQIIDKSGARKTEKLIIK